MMTNLKIISRQVLYIMYNISLLTIFKNETMNLDVFMKHYIWQGVDHFYMIDNNSSDNPLTILQPYIDSGLVTYRRYDEPYKQVEHYRSIYRECNIRKSTKWLVVADLDEFWFVPNSTLVKYLQDNKNLVIYGNWLMFGSDGLINHPTDIRTAITHRKVQHDANIKWIIKCRKFHAKHIRLHVVKAHHLNEQEQARIVTDNEGIHLNHYPIQSKEFFDKVKKTRGDAYNRKSNSVRNDDYFKFYDSDTTFNDTSLRDMIIKCENKN